MFGGGELQKHNKHHRSQPLALWSLLDTIQHYLCFLRLQARISAGNISRPTYQIRFFFPKGNIKLKTDFKKRQDPSYFLISNFLSLEEGVALHWCCLLNSAAGSPCLSQILHFRCYSLSSWLYASKTCLNTVLCTSSSHCKPFVPRSITPNLTEPERPS